MLPERWGIEDSPLTNKEREVLVLLTQGLSSKEAAQRLQLSPQTIDVHRKNIMKKLDIHNVPGLVRWALRTGIISVEGSSFGILGFSIVMSALRLDSA